MGPIVVLLAPGFEETEAIFPVDLLRRAGLPVLTAGLSGPGVTGSHGLTITPDLLLEDLDQAPSAVVLPGGMPGASNLYASQDVRNLLERAFREELWVGAICAAPAVVLAQLGYLKNKSFTCFPDFVAQASSLGGRWVDRDVVLDGKLITSRGVGTAHLFGLQLISALASSEKAQAVAARAVLQI
ncbi:MAG: DJ-1/PfpI family protein [Spirochaetales bacterium]|nr:DJ-1/PfpI family protein [Spirochaetales bacterium]